MFSNRPARLQSPRTFNSKSPYSQENKSRYKRKSLLASHKRISFNSPNVSFSNQSLSQSFNRSLQSLLTTEEAHHRLEGFGTSLPVHVTEVLTVLDAKSDVTVKLSSSGWAWLVENRQLLIWHYKPTQFNKISQCKRLVLQPSNLQLTADLVVVLAEDSSDRHTASCISVSPEGIVRYWANINHESSFIEITIDFTDQICKSITKLQDSQCIVSTLNCSLALLSPSAVQGAIISRVLNASQGIFTGIGRRMSSFLFGGEYNPLHSDTFRRTVSNQYTNDKSLSFYVLSNQNISKWILDESSENLVYRCNVDVLLKDCVAETIWNKEAAQLPCLKTWLIDIQCTSDGLVVFGAAMNSEVSEELNYVFGILHTEGTEPPQSFLSFTVLKYKEEFQTDGVTESPLTDYRFILPDITSSAGYLYNQHSIICVSVSESSGTVDRVDFRAPVDKLLGAGHCDGLALFFSMSHGLISLKETSQILQQSIANESIAEVSSFAKKLETSIISNATVADAEELAVSDSDISRLKAAFLHFCRGNSDEAQMIVNSIFPDNSQLDQLITELSYEMIDDYPASDPRWAESIPSDNASSTSSLLLLHQMEDKLKAHEYYINFLSQIGLFSRLSSLTHSGLQMPSCMLLCEHAEKLKASIALQSIYDQYSSIVEPAVHKVLELRRESYPHSGLTPRDVFFRKVSHIQEFIKVLINEELKTVSSQSAPRDLVQTITKINTIICTMLHDACSYRQSKQSTYQNNSCCGEFCPWTNAKEPGGLSDLLSKQINMTVDHALSTAHDFMERDAIYQQLMELCDLHLDGFTTQIEHYKLLTSDNPLRRGLAQCQQKFEQQRAILIEPFVNQKQYELALSLGEKYCDFNTLVTVCEIIDSEERLQRYLQQFNSRGFADFVFKWYVEKGKRGKLMSSSLADHPQLSQFLKSGENRFMSWLHDVKSGDYYQAHKTLLDLGEKESGILSKKKTLLSLSKLAALATMDPSEDVTSNIQTIDRLQELGTYQETLPEILVNNLCLDVDNMKPMTPLELIEVYLSDYNKELNEYDCKKALDLLEHLNQDDLNMNFSQILLHIWSLIILKTNWDEISVDGDPLESCKDTLFFKTIQLAFTSGMDLQEFLPDVNQILKSNELASLKDNSNFQFLLLAGYEKLQRVIA